MNKVMYSSQKEEWETPNDLFQKLDEEFHFDTDVCALPENAKCPHFYTPEVDGLVQDWKGKCWCNPPYGRKVGEWVKKASEEIRKGASLVVMLVAARTDTKWFHEYIYNNLNAEVRFLKGRLKFGGGKEFGSIPKYVSYFSEK